MMNLAKHLPCKTCGKAIQRDYMATHEKIHLGERPYLCELCGATFTLADRLRVGLRKKSINRYE